jgi:hypothetical protein
MECYYHPDRAGTDTCAICGKSVCKECGLEIAGRIYCKDCLEKIVGLGLDNKTSDNTQTAVAEEPVRTEPARLHKKPVDDTVYQPQPTAEEEIPYAPQEEIQPTPEVKQIQDDSPYNIRDNIEYSGGFEEDYAKPEPIQPQEVEQPPLPKQEPQIAQNEYDIPSQQIAQQPTDNSQEYIYPDHSYEPQPTRARVDLEDRYERYLDDLYFDEEEVPLEEQLAKDEEQYGSLTRKPYQPRKEAVKPQRTVPPLNETPEEMEARIRAEVLAEQRGEKPPEAGIHNLNYQDEKEPMDIIDILLTVVLIIVILIVAYYIIYILFLSAAYPTYMDAIYALTNPQNVINNILSPK